MSEDAEGFLDQVVTWRELGYQAAARVPNNDEYGALPEWAQATLRDHADDPREYVYTLEQFDEAATHDEVWNIAQRQLRQEGTIHNYLRMLWGKKILEWSRTPQKAHDIMFELNNRYALDGRDPNSTSGIHWVMGRYDRPWGPERSIFGKVRYMSSDSARRKLRMKNYLSRGATLF
jgi:deoxyribodipyrimidine photo-lyase